MRVRGERELDHSESSLSNFAAGARWRSRDNSPHLRPRTPVHAKIVALTNLEQIPPLTGQQLKIGPFLRRTNFAVPLTQNQLFRWWHLISQRLENAHC